MTRNRNGAVERGGLAAVLVGGGLFLVGLVLPFVVGRLDRGAGSARERVRPVPTSLDVVIPAYLEAGVIGPSVRRLQNQLSAWPGESRVVVVASDDETAAASEAVGAVVIRRSADGKPAAVNAGVAASAADAVLLTDANCVLSPDDWPSVLREAFVEADLVSAPKGEAGGREAAFWKYESAVKATASGPTMSVAGEFLAFRREDFRQIPRGALTDDLFLARDFVDRGLCVRNAVGIRASEAAAEGSDQWERRVRIAAGVYLDALPGWRRLLRRPAGRQFLAHKGYRMTIGAAGFWIGVLGACLVALPWSAVAMPIAVAAAFALYTRGVGGALGAVSSAVALQLVPVLGMLRAQRRRRQPDAAGWKKVAR